MNHHFSSLVFLMKLSRIRCVFIHFYLLFHIFQLICQILTLAFTLIFLQFAVFKLYLISPWKKDGEEKKRNKISHVTKVLFQIQTKDWIHN